MAALANRWAISLFRQPFNLVRALSASAASSLSSSASSSSAAADTANEPKKPKRKKKKNLFEVAQFLPNWGIGYKMAKSQWRDLSYEITKINLYKDGRHGKAWGIRHKAGIPVADAPVKMSGVHKRGWKYIPETKKTTTATPKLEEQIQS